VPGAHTCMQHGHIHACNMATYMHATWPHTCMQHGQQQQQQVPLRPSCGCGLQAASPCQPAMSTCQLHRPASCTLHCRGRPCRHESHDLRQGACTGYPVVVTPLHAALCSWHSACRVMTGPSLLDTFLFFRPRLGVPLAVAACLHCQWTAHAITSYGNIIAHHSTRLLTSWAKDCSDHAIN
jgi:hypothetical protein